MRIQLTREWYIPKNAVKVCDKQSDGVVYLYEPAPGHLCARAFHGKAAKPDWSYRFSTPTAREAHVAKFFEARRSHAKEKAERAESAKSIKNPFQVGHVLKSTWGYDQTNVDWYQVTRVSAKSVWLREIGATANQVTGSTTGTCLPDIDQFIGEEFIARPNAYGRVWVGRGRFRSARLWNGERAMWSTDG